MLVMSRYEGRQWISDNVGTQGGLTLLSKIGLSSAENEYYAICGKSATGMGLQALLHDWNISRKL